MGMVEQFGFNGTMFAAIIQFVILTFIFIIPAGIGLYFIIRLAVRHGIKDTKKDDDRRKKD